MDLHPSMTHSAGPRIVKSINILIALALAAVLAALYWFVWRPLPQRSGTVTAPVAAPATVSFDTLGVPHIHAASQEDALHRPGVRDRPGPPLADGQPAALRGRRPGGNRRAASARISTANPASLRLRRDRRRRLYDTAARGSRGLRRLRARRQPLHRHPPATTCRWSSPCSATSPARGAWSIPCWSASTCSALSPPRGATI